MVFFTVKQVAEYMNVNEETVRRWLRDKSLIGEDLGGRSGYRISETEFIKFLKERPMSNKSSVWSKLAENGVLIGGGLIAGAGATALLPGMGAVMTAALGYKAMKKMVSKQIKDTENVGSEKKQPQDIERESLEEEIASIKDTIYEASLERVKLEAEGSKVDAELEFLGAWMSHIKDQEELKESLLKQRDLKIRRADIEGLIKAINKKEEFYQSIIDQSYKEGI